MSMCTIWDLPSASLEWSLTRDSSPLQKLANSVPRHMFDLTSLTRMKLPLPSPCKRWSESDSSSLMSQRAQCPCVHYHPRCNDCQTLMEWGPPQPIRMTSSKSILTFGQLKKVVRMHCQCHFEWWHKQRYLTKQACLVWREEQFRCTAVKWATQVTAQEAQHQQAHQQCADHGATPLA